VQLSRVARRQATIVSKLRRIECLLDGEDKKWEVHPVL